MLNITDKQKKQLANAGVYFISEEQANKIPVMPKEQLEKHMKAVEKYLPAKRVNQIHLHFDKGVISLSGSESGYSVYQKQVENLWEDGWLNILRFPQKIEDISISFIEGFFRDIVKKYSVEDLRRFVQIKASTDFIIDKIWDAIKIIANNNKKTEN